MIPDTRFQMLRLAVEWPGARSAMVNEQSWCTRRISNTTRAGAVHTLRRKGLLHPCPTGTGVRGLYATDLGKQAYAQPGLFALLMRDKRPIENARRLTAE